MSKISTIAAALCVLGTMSFAQTTQTPPAEPEGEQAASPTELDLGQPVDAAPALGERYSKATYGDWEMACIKTDQETDPCSLLQIMEDEQGNPIAEMSLFRIANGGQAAAGATIVVPLETLLPAQLTISVDGAAGKRYNYTFCSPLGCVAQIGLTADDVNAFKRGNAATVSLVPAPAPDQKVSVSLSLKGFTAGYDAVDIVDN
ncbi:MAG: invasion associated locus B family protein [Sedimentitalea sp.]